MSFLLVSVSNLKNKSESSFNSPVYIIVLLSSSNYSPSILLNIILLFELLASTIGSLAINIYNLLLIISLTTYRFLDNINDISISNEYYDTYTIILLYYIFIKT